MCGIFGYVGTGRAIDITFKGLESLEYRGYDSWGVAVLSSEGKVQMHKEVGAISDFDLSEIASFEGRVGVGHSRWATHGKVNKVNTHPHYSKNQDLYVVHNGIIDNYLELKKEMIDHGYEFISETDTEVIVHLLDCYLREFDVLEAVKKVDSKLKGRYAFLILREGVEEIIAVRGGAPLIIGVSDEAKFIASDIPAFLEYTNEVMYLDDGEMVVLSQKEAEFYNLNSLEKVEKRLIEVDLDPVESQLGDYPHFMIKEIMEQKDSISRSINQDDNEILEIAELIKNAFGTYFVGCGTAGKVGLAGTYIFSEIAKKHINFEFGSEFKHCRHYLQDESLVIAISQSGETADTIEALEIAQKKGSRTASILNVKESTIDRMTDYTLHIKVGPEKAVASTKATTAQLAIILLLAFAAAGKIDEGKRLLVDTCGEINDMLNPRYEDRLRVLAESIYENESMYIIGKGINYPIALEAAIKLQEVSYIHAEGFAGGELKHGPLALISDNVPVIVFAPIDENYEDIISNATEVKTRGGYVIGVSPENNDVFDHWIKVPQVDEKGLTSPLVNLIPIQILSYHLGLLRGNNPDKPRNLAKSVTVK
jgi:glucosamine--fructose-6-phosphate aminotransferase (isomerizing)